MANQNEWQDFQQWKKSFFCKFLLKWNTLWACCNLHKLNLHAVPPWKLVISLGIHFTTTKCISIARYIAPLPSPIECSQLLWQPQMVTPSFPNPADPGCAQMFQHQCAIPRRPTVTANQILWECHSCEVAIPYLLSPEQEGGLCGWLHSHWYMDVVAISFT